MARHAANAYALPAVQHRLFISWKRDVIQPLNPQQLLHNRYRVLVVDDQITNIQLLNHMLKEHYDVSMARSGEQAITLCQRLKPDLLLLDIVMPDMDGFEVCRRLKADPLTRDIPIIFVTGSDSGDDESRALEAGAVDFMTKPLRATSVLARVKIHLTIKAQADLLRQMAFIDGLTGVANRRHFDDTLRSEWRRARRAGNSVGLVMIDIDHFKAYNDRYGHQAGDHCLKQVARRLRDSLRRPGDLLARYGGEEFVCLLADTDLSGAQLVADTLLRSVRQLALGEEPGVSITISCGVSAAIPLHDDGYELLKSAADGALYQAKSAGRNCCQWHSLDAIGNVLLANSLPQSSNS